MIKILCPDADSESPYRDAWLYMACSFGLKKSDFVSDMSDALSVVYVQSEGGRFFQGTESLVTFEHPENCVYVFGGNDTAAQKEPDNVERSIFIPASPTWEFFNHQAAAIVLYDRFVKRGGFG